MLDNYGNNNSPHSGHSMPGVNIPSVKPHFGQIDMTPKSSIKIHNLT